MKTTPKYLPNNNQKGIGLIELLLSISIIAVIVIGAVALFSTTNESNKAQDLTKGFTTLTSTVHSMFGQQSSYGVAAADLEPPVAATGALPSNMIVGGNDIVSAFGDITVTVGPANVRQFVVTYAANTIPSEVCSKFVPNLLGSVRGIVVNGVAVNTAAAAVTNCNLNLDANGNSTAIVITVD